MRITGKRHAYRVEWLVGFDDDGCISGLDLQFYSDGGAVADLSTSVMERTMLHAENAYFIPHIDIRGRVCFTNYPPNTAFRGFGGPQAIAAIENIIEDIACHLSLDSTDVRVANLYGDAPRDETPYGQVFHRNHLPAIFEQLQSESDYRRRVEALDEIANDPMQLRGLALTPVKFGISFTSKFLNQANALVNVYTDGTVQVSTGGTEMGQGLNTKIRQVVADEFGIDWRQVMVMPTSTEKNNNTSPTAASAGTDLNGAAAVDACQKIRGRLAQLAAKTFADQGAVPEPRPESITFQDGFVRDGRAANKARMEFAELCASARLQRIDLGDRGFYATPGIDFDKQLGKGRPFHYFTQGAAIAEVQIDRFTGQLSVSRVDLLIDIGCPINPGVDMGQVTGGFIQGMGWVTAEALVYDAEGNLLSHSPTTYKIPATTDVPPVFRCDFFHNEDNVDTIRRSKAVGEPPLMLGIAVWAAAKNALRRYDPGAARELRLPATGEELMRCIERVGAGDAPLTASRQSSEK